MKTKAMSLFQLAYFSRILSSYHTDKIINVLLANLYSSWTIVSFENL